MRKISAMYQYSGGTSYKHSCGECNNLITIRKGSRVKYKCAAYGITEGSQTDWKNTSMACKMFNKTPPAIPLFFQDSKSASKKQKNDAKGEEIFGQMSIFDFPEYLPPCK